MAAEYAKERNLKAGKEVAAPRKGSDRRAKQCSVKVVKIVPEAYEGNFEWVHRRTSHSQPDGRPQVYCRTGHYRLVNMTLKDDRGALWQEKVVEKGTVVVWAVTDRVLGSIDEISGETVLRQVSPFTQIKSRQWTDLRQCHLRRMYDLESFYYQRTGLVGRKL
jgi:hypothetical protein